MTVATFSDPDELRRQVLKMARAGHSTRAIARKLHIGREKAERVLLDAGIQPTRRTRNQHTAARLSNEQLQDAARRRKANEPMWAIAKDYGISHTTLRRRLIKAGLEDAKRKLTLADIPPDELPLAEQAVELYRSGLSFTDVGQQLGITKAHAGEYVHALAPDVVRTSSASHALLAYRKPRKDQDQRARCRRCEIVLEEAGDSPDAGICHMCRDELAYMRNKARKATGKAARFYATYLERGETAA
jgi:transposase